MSEGFRDFLADSFAALRCETPAAYAALCRRLAQREVALAVDGEVVPVRFDGAEAVVLEAPSAPDIDVRTTKAAIVDLIDARLRLDEAVMTERLHLRGSPDDLLLFHDGLLAYLHGAVRAPSFPGLLRSFRSDSRSGGDSWNARETA